MGAVSVQAGVIVRDGDSALLTFNLVSDDS
jgi:hypothetical protein